MSANLRKMELEKNNFIRELSKEQFDGVITNKYKKVFIDYFNGNINDSELAERINKNLELINIYENGENGKIDSNQYLYSAIVDVALNYYNVANGFETCINKMNLLASYFQLCAIAGEKLKFLNELISDAFFVNSNVSGDSAFLDAKLVKIKDTAESLDSVVGEISKHENVISDVEKESGTGFCDEIHIDKTIHEMYVMCSNSVNGIKESLYVLKQECVDESTGANLDIMNGTITGGDE